MYVEREPDGTVKGVYACKQPGYAEEEMNDDNLEIEQFHKRTNTHPVKGSIK